MMTESRGYSRRMPVEQTSGPLHRYTVLIRPCASLAWSTQLWPNSALLAKGRAEPLIRHLPVLKCGAPNRPNAKWPSIREIQPPRLQWSRSQGAPFHRAVKVTSPSRFSPVSFDTMSAACFQGQFQRPLGEPTRKREKDRYARILSSGTSAGSSLLVSSTALIFCRQFLVAWFSQWLRYRKTNCRDQRSRSTAPTNV